MPRKPKPRWKFSIHLTVIALILLVATLVTETIQVRAETAYIYGRALWWTTRDTIQFLGDSDLGSPAFPCPQWHDDCPMDNGFLFRKVYNVDPYACTYDSTLTCYVAAVVCCFWVGGCTEQPAGGICDGACEGIDDTCPSHCYCKSIWAVKGFEASPGDDQKGCYEIELVCETGGLCLVEEEAHPCDVTYGHWTPDVLGEELGFRLDTQIYEGSEDEEVCTGATLLRNDDGLFENAYGWRGIAVSPPDYGSWAEGYSSDYVCGLQFLFTQTGYFNGQTMDVFVWESDGNGDLALGANPGNVICLVPGVTPGPVALWPSISIHDVSVCCPTGGPHFVGFWGNWPGTICGWYIASDQDGSGLGSPRTKIAPDIGYPTGWQHPNVVPAFTGCMDVGIREFAGYGDCSATPTAPTTWGRIKSLHR